MLISDLPSNRAVRIGQLFFKPESVLQIVARSVRLVALSKPREGIGYGWYFGQSGSCTLVRCADRCFVVTTRHELLVAAEEVLKEENLETFVFCDGGDSLNNIPVDKCIFIVGDEEEEFRDLLFFQVHQGWGDLKKKISNFFAMEPTRKGDAQHSFAIGHPASIGMIDYENLEFNVKTAIVECVRDTNFTSSARYFRRYSYIGQRQDLDGFSGGAIFSLGEEEGGFVVKLDGIIVRGGNGYIYAIDSDFLQIVLEEKVAPTR